MSLPQGLAQRPIGNTGLSASVLGFGTGDNAGLMVLGSVAESVLRQVTIPMLLIRPAPETVAKAKKATKISTPPVRPTLEQAVN